LIAPYRCAKDIFQVDNPCLITLIGYRLHNTDHYKSFLYEKINFIDAIIVK